MLTFDSTDRKLHLINDEDGSDSGEYCEGFIIEKTLSDVDSGEEIAIVKAFTKSGVKVFPVPANHFTVNTLPGCLLKYGIHILSDREPSTIITAYALDSKKAAPVDRIYSRLGWYTLRDKRVYLAHHIMRGKKLFEKSEYAYSEKLTPSGTFEAWRNGLMPFLARPEIALALIIGASAAVVPLLKEAGCFTDSPIFALIGPSSTYKTTALKLTASIYGKPEIGSGIIDTMMDTTNYFFHQLGKKNGFIHLIDDISAASDHNFTNDLYYISMGRSRGKLNPDSTPKPLATWCTTVIYTGETSIFDQTNHNGGLYARLIELSFEWLTDADDINGFYDTINNNYGVALQPLISYLFTLTSNDIRSLYAEALKVVQAEIPPKDRITRRITERFAILVMTLSICAQAWEIDLIAKPVIKLLVEAYKKNYAVVDPITIAIEKLREQILANNHKFLGRSQKSTDPLSAWGIYGEYRQLPCLWIGKEAMRRLAAAAEIQSFEGIRKELADKGFLVKDKSNHYVFDRNITSGHSIPCYGVYTHCGTPKPTSKLAKNKKDKSAKKLNGSPNKAIFLTEDDPEESNNED